jgi:two-component system OmpR family sensor kinase
MAWNESLSGMQRIQIIMSIRRQLVFWLLCLLLVAGIAGTIGLYFKILDEADQLFDYHLQQTAFTLRDQVLAQGVPSISDEAQYDLIVQVWSLTGKRVYMSHPQSNIPNRAPLGFATVATQEDAWRVFSVQLRDRTIQVAQPLVVRQALAKRLAERILLPFALLLPIIGLIVWVLVGRGLKPLDRVANDVASRSPTALSPLNVAGLPKEIAPLVYALNDLLTRLQHSIGAQRTFVADAAHELRTPLAAIQLQAQVAERAKTDADRTVAFEQLKNGIGRTIHMVQQLLTLARQEPEVMMRPFEQVELSQLAKQMVAEMAPLAQAKHIDLGMNSDIKVTVTGDAEALRTMLSNIIDNAIAYIPDGGKIDVAVTYRDGQAVLSVADDGPGIPYEEREQVLARFYRREGNEMPGSGLGLAIVKNVANRHFADLTLSDSPDGSGLCVSVHFPRVGSE